MVDKTTLEHDIEMYYEKMYGSITATLQSYNDTGHEWFNVQYILTKNGDLIGEFYGSAQYVDGQLDIKAINARSAL